MEFPLYRKYSNAKSIFKIHSKEKMTEIQQIGKRHVVYELEAKILPERLLLEDLIYCKHPSIIAIGKDDYELLKREILADHSID